MIKKLLGILVLCSLIGGNVQAQSLISINKYLKDNINSLEDPITLTYLMNRCSAAYIFASVVTNKTMPDSADKFTEAANKVYLFSIEILIRDLKYEYKVADSKTKKEIDAMFNYYQKDGEDIYARTGKYMENSYIGEDLQQCNVLMLAFNQR
ncbi:hypothetical protein OAW70_01340 [Candidatus Pelagibacter ubique]|nr:hypothetical protein [Candidatus Pelagibacter ubique]